MKKMTNYGVFALTLCALMASPARAATVSECTGQIDALQVMVKGVEIGGRDPERTRASLLSKLTEANIKLDKAKFCDSIIKLSDFRAKVQELLMPNRKGETKLGEADGANLTSGADDAMLCVRDLDPSCP